VLPATSLNERKLNSLVESFRLRGRGHNACALYLAKEMVDHRNVGEVLLEVLLWRASGWAKRES